uniref:FLZ-type domain-containing protein n=1 Tax=Setaria italica TaxID=4555 RepID=K4A0E9_SETIT
QRSPHPSLVVSSPPHAPARERAKSLRLHFHGQSLIVCSSRLQSRSVARSSPGLKGRACGERRCDYFLEQEDEQRGAGRKMMVGKRERDCKNPMRRTTSMTEFAPPDVLAAVAEDEEAQLPDNNHRGGAGGQDWLSAFDGGAGGAAAQEDWLAAYRARAAPARAGLRRNSADYSVVETAAFLRACGLCCRRLGPGRDTFMYKYV